MINGATPLRVPRETRRFATRRDTAQRRGADERHAQGACDGRGLCVGTAGLWAGVLDPADQYASIFVGLIAFESGRVPGVGVSFIEFAGGPSNHCFMSWPSA